MVDFLFLGFACLIPRGDAFYELFDGGNKTIFVERIVGEFIGVVAGKHQLVIDFVGVADFL